MAKSSEQRLEQWKNRENEMSEQERQQRTDKLVSTGLKVVAGAGALALASMYLSPYTQVKTDHCGKVLRGDEEVHHHYYDKHGNRITDERYSRK